MKAYLKGARISSKKANLVAALVRRKNVQEAVDMLKFTPKKAAPMLRKLIESAAANAENNFKQKRDSLFVKEIIVTEGPTMKRHVPISRGRVHPVLKRTAHITVKLEVKDTPQPKAKATPKKEESKKEEPKAEKKEEKAVKEPAKKATTKKTDK